jgi:hypothetical protein
VAKGGDRPEAFDVSVSSHTVDGTEVASTQHRTAGEFRLPTPVGARNPTPVGCPFSVPPVG